MSSAAGGFRWDIQGLRAMAVLAVVLFHINPELLPGGFLGVDVFFVISGYLIMGFIWRDLHNGSFNLLDFYSRRVRRLFPALFVMIFFTTIGVYFLLLPEETANYAKSMVSTLFYVSNFYFYSESDYFDAGLQFAPLLHTWSLSVEEQFYIIFPLLLAVIYRKQAAKALGILVLIAFASFVLSEYLVHADPSLAFYLSPARFWQFIAGGLLSVSASRFRIGNLAGTALGAVSLLALLFCFLVYDETTPFPGVNAALPTIATVALIVAGSCSKPVYQLLACAPARFFGNISYSLYLWHWPVIIFYKLSVKSLPAMQDQMVMLLVSILLGYLSWRYIETAGKRFRFSGQAWRPIALSLSASMVFTLAGIFAFNGLSYRYTQAQVNYSAFMNYDMAGYREGTCFLSSKADDVKFFDPKQCMQYHPAQRNILLIGDSHAAHWYSALAATEQGNVTLSQVTASGCKPVMPPEGKKRCTDLMHWAYEEMLAGKRFERIILSARWVDEDIPALRDTINVLRNYTDDIVVLGPVVEYNMSVARLLAMNYSDIKIGEFRQYDTIKRYDEDLLKGLSGSVAHYVSVLNTICPPNNGCMMTTHDGVPMQFDYGHLTHEGALELVKIMRDRKLL